MVIVIMVSELGLIQIRLLKQGNGKVVPKKEKELKLGQMDIFMMVNLMTVNGTAKEL